MTSKDRSERKRSVLRGLENLVLSNAEPESISGFDSEYVSKSASEPKPILKIEHESEPKSAQESEQKIKWGDKHTTTLKLPDDYIRTTLVIRKSFLRNLKMQSASEMKRLYEVLDEALADYMKKLELRKIKYEGQDDSD